MTACQCPYGLRSADPDPGTPPLRPFGGPTAGGVAFGVYGSQASEGGTQKAGA
jgi:hypothetical protein